MRDDTIDSQINHYFHLFNKKKQIKRNPTKKTLSKLQRIQ